MDTFSAPTVDIARGPRSATRAYADVAVSGVLPGATSGVLSYAIPDAWVTDPVPGQLVWVPLRKRVEPGIVISVRPEPPAFDVRDLHSIALPPFVIPADRFELGRWLARETASSVFAALSLFMPPGITTRTIDVLSLAVPRGAVPDSLTAAQRKVVDLLGDRGELTLDSLRAETGQTLTSVVPRLEEAGIIRREIHVDQHIPGRRTERFVRLLRDDPRLTARSPKQSAIRDELARLVRFRRDGRSDLVPVTSLRDQVEVDAGSLAAMVNKGVIEVQELSRSDAPAPRPAPAPVLSPEQAAAWAVVERALERRDSTPHLLFGVTGSGKTEIYLRGVAWCLRHGRSTIVLVPEIGLATQVMRRFIDRFPGLVVVMHSAQTDAQRYEIWKGIEAGDFRVVVGPRSALFAPVANLGLIVLDEEHESTYKQDSEPRYHARRMAARLAEATGAALVLGSATPAIESAWNTREGHYVLLSLPERVDPVGGATGRTARPGGLALPGVEIVDLRLELQAGHVHLLSRRLQETVTTALRRGEQAILLLNRRGTSTVVLCRSCGHRIICPLCDISLVYHRDRHQMLCHRCDYREAPPGRCPDCGGLLDFFGAGTQRVEDEVRKLFPQARVMRWDQDSVRRHGGFEVMLGRVERGDVDIIVGTQMVAKGFDLPKVTAIGVVQADTLLHLPDFRSAERTFQLLTQVAGRAGRRAPGSTVIVQTYTPEHYAIVAASRHDYGAFYDEEIDFREQFGFPPFARLARYLYRHDQERAAAIEAEMMARALARHARSIGAELEILGPTPAFAARVRGKYQWQLILRTHDLDALLDNLPTRPGWIVDIDPQSML
ncbi:MAG TPA: primosomal protein N' [Thermomicrobiales bacterium]|nr:primosomal protein N' [Thermomicrobiales bacterium]